MPKVSQLHLLDCRSGVVCFIRRRATATVTRPTLLAVWLSCAAILQFAV